MKKRILCLLLTLLTITALLPMGAFASPLLESTPEADLVVPEEFRGTYTGTIIPCKDVEFTIEEYQVQVFKPFSATLPLVKFEVCEGEKYDIWFKKDNCHFYLLWTKDQITAEFNDGVNSEDLHCSNLVKQAENGSGFTLSDGNWWIVIAGAVVIIGGIIAIVVATKKKAAFAQRTGKEDDK